MSEFAKGLVPVSRVCIAPLAGLAPLFIRAESTKALKGLKGLRRTLVRTRRLWRGSSRGKVQRHSPGEPHRGRKAMGLD